MSNAYKTVKYMLKSCCPNYLIPSFIKFQYYKKMGKKCDLKNPVTYTEKIQWSKLYRDNKSLSMFADKIEVRKWVKSIIGEEYLIPMVGKVIEDVSDFDISVLPERFVIKANHGCGYNILVDDKEAVDVALVKKKIDEWLSHNFAYEVFEMQYKDITPKIYFEENIRSGDMKDLPDYKFFCFNGKVYCSYTMLDYTLDHNKGRLGFFDKDYKIMPYYRKDYYPITEQLEKPKNYKRMVEIAEALSEGFSHVRVDLYNIDGKIYFGEMTFSTCGGYCKFEPEEFDMILGEQWNLNDGI